MNSKRIKLVVGVAIVGIAIVVMIIFGDGSQIDVGESVDSDIDTKSTSSDKLTFPLRPDRGPINGAGAGGSEGTGFGLQEPAESIKPVVQTAPTAPPF